MEIILAERTGSEYIDGVKYDLISAKMADGSFRFYSCKKEGNLYVDRLTGTTIEVALVKDLYAVT